MPRGCGARRKSSLLSARISHFFSDLLSSSLPQCPPDSNSGSSARLSTVACTVGLGGRKEGPHLPGAVLQGHSLFPHYRCHKAGATIFPPKLILSANLFAVHHYRYLYLTTSNPYAPAPKELPFDLSGSLESEDSFGIASSHHLCACVLRTGTSRT